MSTRPSSAALATAPSPVNPGLIRMHDVQTGLGDASPEGLPSYAERAALLPGFAVVPSLRPPVADDYLLGLGLGAASHGGVIRVSPNGTLYDALSGKGFEDEFELVRTLVAQGYQIEPFLATDTELRFAARLGFRYQDAFWAPQPGLAEVFNDKIHLRRMVERHGIPGIKFPYYRIVPLGNDAEIYRVLEDMLGHHDQVFIKHPCFATGDGVFCLHRNSNWRVKAASALRWLRNCSRPPLEVIIDVAVPGYDASVQIEVLETGPVFIAKTLMHIKDDVAHAGNVLSTQPLTPYERSERDMCDQSMAVAWKLWEHGYRGYLSFDFRLSGVGAFMLEDNARTTGAMYPTGIFLQLLDQGVTECAVSWYVLETELGFSFEHLLDLLSRTRHRSGTLLFEGAAGILPCVVVPLHSGGTKIMAASIGADVTQAVDFVGHLEDLVASTVS
jgi:hypothetical protein